MYLNFAVNMIFLQMFQRTPVQISIESEKLEEILPINVFSADTPISFIIPGADIWLSPEIYCFLRCKIVNGDGSAIANDAAIAGSPNFAQSLFSGRYFEKMQF